MLVRAFLLVLSMLVSTFPTIASGGEPLTEANFKNPPDSTKPWTYWYWMNADVTADGITKDLEHMSRVGIAKAFIGNIYDKQITGYRPKYKDMTPEWQALVKHALSEAKRLGIEIYMFNGPGWSQSGGPWMKPELSMRRVYWQEFTVAGGGEIDMKVRPSDIPASQDIAVLALPEIDLVSIEGRSPALANGPGNSAIEPTLVFIADKAITMRSLAVYAPEVQGTLYAIRDGKRKEVTKVNGRAGNEKTDFLTDEPHLFGFADTTADHFELVCQKPPKGKVLLTASPCIPQHADKQMGRMHPTPSPKWDSYKFQPSVQPADASVVISQDEMINLSDRLTADGTLKAMLPSGNWTVIYFGMKPTGKTNHPASDETTGLECDKMSKEAIEFHFESYFGPLLKVLSPEERSNLTGLVIDSYEVGAQNWTDRFEEEFEKRSGYSPIKFLPVMTGRMVESAKQSDQFLWDVRRNVADLISENYVGGLRDIAHRHNMKLWMENYGHWGFPGEFLSYARHADQLGGEFWTNQPLGNIECRAASSAVHIYGKRRVYVEAFTSGLDLKQIPLAIKSRGEELMSEGVNHCVLHVYATQTNDLEPGNNPWFGTAFHRNNPWARDCRDWVRYLQRCHFMLQQGESAADVAVYIGDFAPQMTGPENPVPPGYDYDFIGSDAILNYLHVVDGEWVVYDESNPERIASRYAVLAMPKLDYVRPEVLERIALLRQAGGKVIDGVPVTKNALAKVSVPPMVQRETCSIKWKARRLEDGMVFLVSNFEKPGPFEAKFRVTGKSPVLYNPATGEVERLGHYRIEEDGTRVFLNPQDKRDSYFVVFKEAPTRPFVVDASPSTGIDVSFDSNDQLVAESTRAGEYTLKLSDGSEKKVTFSSPPQPLAIEGWKQVPSVFDSKHVVTMETTFDLVDIPSDHSMVLEFGDVVDMVKVTLNDHPFETLWVPPFSKDVTRHLQRGENRLRVTITSAFGNEPTVGKTNLTTRLRKVIE